MTTENRYKQPEQPEQSKEPEWLLPLLLYFILALMAVTFLIIMDGIGWRAATIGEVRKLEKRIQILETNIKGGDTKWK